MVSPRFGMNVGWMRREICKISSFAHEFFFSSVCCNNFFPFLLVLREVPERYQLLQPIGSGAYGLVWWVLTEILSWLTMDFENNSYVKENPRALWLHSIINFHSSALDAITNTKVAIKKLNRPFQTATHAKRTFRELRLLKHMNHENIIGLLDTFYHGTTLEAFQQIYLVTHLMGADLNNIIRTQRLTDDHVQFLVYQMLRGLKYIHSAGVIHRDLKPSNLAVNEDCELRILDFGLARPAESEMTGYVATRWYRAPEIMLSKTSKTIAWGTFLRNIWSILDWMHYNMTVDVWSVGCIMAELLTGRTLFPGSDREFSYISIGIV